jgi:hypothetical protein
MLIRIKMIFWYTTASLQLPFSSSTWRAYNPLYVFYYLSPFLPAPTTFFLLVTSTRVAFYAVGSRAVLRTPSPSCSSSLSHDFLYFFKVMSSLHSLKATRQFGARCAPYPYAKEQRQNKHLTTILNRFPPPCSKSMCCYLLAYVNRWLKMKYNQWSSFSHTIQGSSIFCWLR